MNTSGTARKTILAVDDDPHILEVLEVRLVSAGYDVITAASDGPGSPGRAGAQDPRAPGHFRHPYARHGRHAHARRDGKGAPGHQAPIIIFLTAHGSIPGAV